MVTMESIDLPRALADFEAYLKALTNSDEVADEGIEAVTSAFVRHAYTQGIPALTALRDRIAQSELEQEDRDDLVASINDAIPLIRNES